MSDDPLASGAVKRLRALKPAQFYLAAKAGNLAIDAVLADIKDVLDVIEFRPPSPTPDPANLSTDDRFPTRG